LRRIAFPSRNVHKWAPWVSTSTPLPFPRYGRKARDLLEEGGPMVTHRETRMQHGVDFAPTPEMREWVHSVITGEPVITEKPPSAP
jgi:hypothetical protein